MPEAKQDDPQPGRRAGPDRQTQEPGRGEVVEAIDGTEPVFRCTEIRQRGPLAVPPRDCVRPCAIARAMDLAEAAWRQALDQISIADLVTGIDADSGGTAMGDVRRWLSAR